MTIPRSFLVFIAIFSFPLLAKQHIAIPAESKKIENCQKELKDFLKGVQQTLGLNFHGICLPYPDYNGNGTSLAFVLTAGEQDVTIDTSHFISTRLITRLKWATVPIQKELILLEAPSSGEIHPYPVTKTFGEIASYETPFTLKECQTNGRAFFQNNLDRYVLPMLNGDRLSNYTLCPAQIISVTCEPSRTSPEMATLIGHALWRCPPHL